ncbi:MAG: DapH/DapD/GlmU-related protein [Coriobacteriia bacterium]|nr:DapH/DapD/GlmU-related protein [Coriobacteriia bacterium]
MKWLYAMPIVRGGLLRLGDLLFRLRYRSMLGQGVRVYGWPLIRAVPGSTITVGDRAVLISDAEFAAWGLNHPCHIRTVASRACIQIGDDVGMSGVTITCAERVEIGNRVMLGANVSITDTDSHPVDVVPRRYEKRGTGVSAVHIEDDVFIGAGAIVLKGVTIGAGSVIGSGSVVTASVPAAVVCAGNPARVVRALQQSLEPPV